MNAASLDSANLHSALRENFLLTHFLLTVEQWSSLAGLQRSQALKNASAEQSIVSYHLVMLRKTLLSFQGLWRRQQLVG